MPHARITYHHGVAKLETHPLIYHSRGLDRNEVSQCACFDAKGKVVAARLASENALNRAV